MKEKVNLELDYNELSVLSIAMLTIIEERLKYIKNLYSEDDYTVDNIKNIGINSCKFIIDCLELQAKIDNLFNNIDN